MPAGRAMVQHQVRGTLDKVKDTRTGGEARGVMNNG
jgi:hypothetical protein